MAGRDRTEHLEASALSARPALRRIPVPAALLRLRSDEQLVALLRAGHDDAFAAIHDRYRSRLFAYARQMMGGSAPDAEEVLQDVFVRTYDALSSSEHAIDLKPWLYRVAHNRCIDGLRRPRPAAADLLDANHRPVPDALEEVERREDLRRLVADVRRLPVRQRSVLLMREFEGLSYAELAESHAMTIPAVKSLLVRARSGLVDARGARERACTEVRAEVCLAVDHGVRASGDVRHHLRDCADCRSYRRSLKATSRSLAAFAPAGAGPLGLLAELLGIGGGATGGGIAAASGGAAATKVCVVLCTAVVGAGGAIEVREQLAQPSEPAPPAVKQLVSAQPPQPTAAAAATPVAAAPAVHEQADEALRAAPREEEGDTAVTDAPLEPSSSGGAAAPAIELAEVAPDEPVAAPEEAERITPDAPATEPAAPAEPEGAAATASAPAAGSATTSSTSH